MKKLFIIILFISNSLVAQTVKPLTNYSFEAKMKKWPGAAGAISFATTYNADPSLGQITMSLDNASTGIITSGRYNYDIVLNNLNNNIKTKVITGQATVNSTVT